jgi:amidophosphoribosyltransferase
MLYGLQHRGQEGCGIVAGDEGKFRSLRGQGLVADVFDQQHLSELKGTAAIGHVRYGSKGRGSRKNVQPLTINHVKGSLALAHNGNLTNAAVLRRELELQGSIFHTTSDIEVIAYQITKQRLESASIEEAVLKAMATLEGAYSLVMMSPRKLIGVRDPLGIRPLCLGQKADGIYVIASESCALDAVGAQFVRDIEPGEVVIIDDKGLRSIRNSCNNQPKALCVFEYIYFARPDSVIDGSSVHLARQQAGVILAQEHPIDADVVIGVPDSGIDAAIGFARQSGIPYGVGLIKNKYIGRSFIEPTKQQREEAVRIKLNVLAATVKNQRVILVDDSIVRGTTSARIVKLLREAGAKEVHMRVSAPPFRYACYFGTGIDSADKLIANRHNIDEIATVIGVDSLGYLPVEELEPLVEPYRSGICTACFTGKYPLDISNAVMKSQLEEPLKRISLRK